MVVVPTSRHTRTFYSAGNCGASSAPAAGRRGDHQISIDSVLFRHLRSTHFSLLDRLELMEAAMAKYLFQVSYTAQGAQGLLKRGGSKRRAAAEQAAKSAGGKIESFYFAFGDADAFVIAEVPDQASASAIS